MAKKQVTVNEEMIRGIMAGDIPNYGKEDISVDDAMTTDESDRNECGSGNPEPVPAEKSTGRQKRRKDGTDSYRKQFLMGGNVLQRQQAYIGINNYLFIQKFRKYSINSLVYWVTYVHNVVYSFYRSMIYCYINSTQRCAGSIVIDIIPTNGADKRKFFPFAPYFPVTNVIKRYFYPYFPAIIGIKGYSFPYFPYLSGIMKIKTALYSLFSRLDWHKTVVFPCLGEIYEGIRSLSWEIPVT